METPLNSVLGDSSASEPGLQAASQPAETPAPPGKASVIAANSRSLETVPCQHMESPRRAGRVVLIVEHLGAIVPYFF